MCLSENGIPHNMGKLCSKAPNFGASPEMKCEQTNSYPHSSLELPINTLNIVGLYQWCTHCGNTTWNRRKIGHVSPWVSLQPPEEFPHIVPNCFSQQNTRNIQVVYQKYPGFIHEEIEKHHQNSEFFRESTYMAKWLFANQCMLFWLVSVSVKTTWVNRRFTHMFIDHNSKYLLFDTQSSVQHIKNMIFHITWYSLSMFIMASQFFSSHIFHIQRSMILSAFETSRTR